MPLHCATCGHHLNGHDWSDKHLCWIEDCDCGEFKLMKKENENGN